MKPSIDNIGYAVVAISMLVLSIAAIAEHTRMPAIGSPVFELERVTIVASRDDLLQARLAASDALEPAARAAQ